MRKANLHLSALLLLAPASAAFAQDITGEVRSSFLKSAVESCVKAASTPDNLKVLTPEILQKTCTCYAQHAADIITGPELRAIVKGETAPPGLDAKLEPLLEPCLKEAIP